MAETVAPKVEKVTPAVMTPLEKLEGDALFLRVSQLGERCVLNLAEDSRYLSEFCDKLDNSNIWRKIAPTWDEFCMEAFGHPSWYVDMIREGVALLDNGDGKPVPVEASIRAVEERRKKVVAEKAKMIPELDINGRRRKPVSSELPRGLIPSSSSSWLPRGSGESTNSEYLVARIKRDRPDIADRMVKGEFSSVNEAARQAGITVRPTVKLGDPKTVASSIARLQGQEYVSALIDALEQVRQQAKGQET